MQSKSVSFFILTSPAGLKNSIAVIDKYIDKEKTYLILFFTGIVPENMQHHWNEIIDIESFGPLNPLVKALNKRCVVTIINSKRKLFNLFDFYIMDFDPITNYISHFFDGNKNIFVIEDGVANYTLSIPMKHQTYFRPIWKKLFYLLVGIKTNVYRGSCTGIELDSITAQYVQFPKLSNYPSKSRKIPTKSISYVPEKGRVLILGQPMYRNNQNEYLKYLDGLIKSLKLQISHKIELFYKPHRWENYDLEEFLRRNRIKSLKENTPAEDVVKDLKANIICGFGSSALFNISALLAPDIKSDIQVYAYPYLERERYTQVLPLYSKAGVVVLDEI
jgi:hypothetical protein